MSFRKAIATNNLEKVKQLLASEADVNQENREDLDYFLERAAELGHWEIVKAFLEAEPSARGYGAALKCAAWRNCPEAVKSLVKCRNDFGDRLPFYNEALNAAALLELTNIIRILLHAGADINACDGRQGTPLHRAAQDARIPLAQFLLKSGAAIDSRNEDQRTPLMSAIWEDQTPMFELLLSAGADINVRDSQGETPLMLAIQRGRQTISERLIEVGANLDLVDNEALTALILAVERGHKTIVERLIAAGADINLCDRHGNNALTHAEKDRWQISTLAPPPPEPPTEAEEELNVFEKCARFDALKKQQTLRRREQIAQILRQARIQERGLEELALIQATERGRLEIVEALLNTGVNPNHIDPNGRIALICAASQGHEAIVSALLAAGANPDLRFDSSRTATISAAEKGDWDIIWMLLEAGANPHLGEYETDTYEGYQAIDYAQRLGHWDAVGLLREMGGKRRRKHPVESWRGVDSIDVSDCLMLVRASVEAVAEAFACIRNAAIWERDVFEKEVELTNCCFEVFQFTGHPWTIVRQSHIREESLTMQDAAELSDLLSTQAIGYETSKSCDLVCYEFFESGQLLERFSTLFSPHEFESQLRQVDIHNIENFDEFEFVDAFVRSQNAYIPAIRSFPGAYRGWEPGDRAKLCIEGLDPDDLRMDYVAVRSQT